MTARRARSLPSRAARAGLALDALAGGQGQGRARAELAGRQERQRQRRRRRHHRHAPPRQKPMAAERALRIVLAMAAAGHETGCSDGNSSTRPDARQGTASSGLGKRGDGRRRRRARSDAGRPRSRGSPGWGDPCPARRAASTSAREEPQSPTACAQSTPSARADDSSPSAAHRDNKDSEADTLIRNCYPDTAYGYHPPPATSNKTPGRPSKAVRPHRFAWAR